jgi:hypothetical protein
VDESARYQNQQVSIFYGKFPIDQALWDGKRFLGEQPWLNLGQPIYHFKKKNRSFRHS